MFYQTRTYNPSAFFIKTITGQPESGKKVVQMFISVDPLVDKYPGISSYAYCANNPLKYVDPDGMQIIITGDEASTSKAVEQMQSKTSNLSFSRDSETGVITSTGEAKTKEEKYMQKIINDPNISVNIRAQNHNKIDENNIMGNEQGGAFMGNEVTFNSKGRAISVDALQVVNVNQMATDDKRVNNPGNYIWHEIAEGFSGGEISLRKGIPACPAINGISNSIYDKAHYKAGKYFQGGIMPIYSQHELPAYDTPSLIGIISNRVRSTKYINVR